MTDRIDALRNKVKDHPFLQQELRAIQPVFTPRIAMMFLAINSIVSLFTACLLISVEPVT